MCIPSMSIYGESYIKGETYIYCTRTKEEHEPNPRTTKKSPTRGTKKALFQDTQ